MSGPRGSPLASPALGCPALWGATGGLDRQRLSCGGMGSGRQGSGVKVRAAISVGFARVRAAPAVRASPREPGLSRGGVVVVVEGLGEGPGAHAPAPVVQVPRCTGLALRSPAEYLLVQKDLKQRGGRASPC